MPPTSTRRGHSFPKGNSGYTNKRKDRRVISQRLTSMLHEKAMLQKRDAEGNLKFDSMGRPMMMRLAQTNLEKICENVVRSAVANDADMIEFLTDRIEGKAHQAISFEDQDGVPQQMPSLTFNFVGDTHDDENPHVNENLKRKK